MAQHEIVVDYGSLRGNATLVDGWVSQPDGRGTIDVIWSCSLTVLLASWSVICLNLPSEEEGFWKQMRRKLHWTGLVVIGPEVVFQLAMGEWIMARHWKRKFQALPEKPTWTLTHSFYANMGGFILRTPDHGSFPINAHQLHYLVENKYLRCPTISKKQIGDKNKAAKVVRTLTLLQTLWFLVNCIARLAQGLSLTTIELSTLAFILSAAGSFFCWFDKPMDVETPDYLHLTVPIADIHLLADVPVDDNWVFTPLDFINAKKEWPWTLYWHSGVAMIEKVTRMPWLVLKPTHRPVRRLPDDFWPEPTLRALPALFVFHVGYAAVLMAGWNLDLPTRIELLLWRVAASVQLGTILSGWATMPLQMENTPEQFRKMFAFAFKDKDPSKPKRTRTSQSMRKWYSRDSISEAVESRAEKVRTITRSHPHWRVTIRLFMVYQVTWVIYIVTRFYIIAEDLVSLRALPASAFKTVNWWPFSHI